MDRYHIVSQFKQRERVVIIDPAGTCYLSPLLQFLEAMDLPIQQAELATMASGHEDGEVRRTGNRTAVYPPMAIFSRGPWLNSCSIFRTVAGPLK